MNEKQGIFGFAGKYAFHAFQAAKTLDQAERLRISQLSTPGLAKKAGRQVKIREDWNLIRVSVMEELTRIKYSESSLSSKLAETGNLYLEETNWWGDCFWGVCRNKGENNLGKVLMSVRSEIKPSV